jgi:uncharacterized protein
VTSSSSLAPEPAAPATGWLDRLLHLHDTPVRTAAAFALGVFFSFSPFLGLQILLAMGTAFALRLNRAAVFVGLNANLPWFIVPWYGSMTVLAARVMGWEGAVSIDPLVQTLSTSASTPTSFLERAADLVAPVFVPFMVGSTAGAAVVGAGTFLVSRAVLTRRAARAADTA